MRTGIKKSKSPTFLDQFHEHFREESLLSFDGSEINSSSAQSQVRSESAPHIDTIHSNLHVLTGGEKSIYQYGPPSGVIRTHDLSSHGILLYFNLFKGLSDGVFSAEEFRGTQEYERVRVAKLLLDGDADYLRRFVRIKSVEIGQEEGAFEAYCQHVSSTSKNYVQHAFDWMNRHVIAGDIDAMDYVMKISEAERFSEADRTLRQKVYSNSNTKALLEAKGLEGATSDEGERGEEVPSRALSSASAAKVGAQQSSQTEDVAKAGSR